MARSEAWMRRLGFTVPGDVTALAVPRAQGPAATAPLTDRDAACVTALNYDQYWQLIAAGLRPDELQVFHYGDFGVATLQDGLYATADAIADPVRSDALVRLLRASLQGWQYAVAHQAEAVAIVLDDGRPENQADRQLQARMMSAVARLTESGLQRMGYLQLLLQSGPPALLPAAPAGAWSHAIWQRAGKPE